MMVLVRSANGPAAYGSDADEIFENLDFHLCFVGHTHVPMVYTCKKGRMKFVPGEPFRLDPEDRCIINPGSVGQPGDGDPRASFCVYEKAVRRCVREELERE
jgi:diadenosine tetraphosphatase ApaH/serine/threonine PP2A family protein phosphatase